MSSPPQLTTNDLIQSYTNYERYHPNNRINLRVLIPRSYSGKIIGPQGKTIQGITNFYHVFLQFSKYESPRQFMRLFHMRGKSEDCANACTNCLELLVKAFNDPILNGMDFILPDLFINFLKEGGKKQNGENIFQDMAKQTNTEVRIMPRFLPNSTERIVRISVPAGEEYIRNFYQAVKLLTQQLEENITLAMCAPGNKFYKQEAEDDLVFMDTVPSQDEDDEIYCELSTEAQRYMQYNNI